jgi:putative ABC transport system permease protein
MALVLGESLLLGAGAGFISSAGTWYLVNNVFGGVPFPIAFFPSFFIPADALWWGPLVGGLAALGGSFAPAWSASTVRVTEVFAKVA